MGLKLLMELLEFSQHIVLFALSLCCSATDFMTWVTVVLEVFTFFLSEYVKKQRDFTALSC